MIHFVIFVIKKDMESMRNRRTIRKYSQQKIEDKLLNNLLQLACKASNTGNMQLYSIIVTKDKENKKKLAPTHFNQPQVEGAPVVLTFCADVNRYNKWCKYNNTEPGTDNFLFFTNAAIDAIIATQTFCVAAEEEGLGICYLGTTTYNAQQIIDILKLPKGVIPICTLSVGYPDENVPQQLRLPLKSIVHTEEYKNYSTQDIKQIYKETEEDETNKNFVKINNKNNLAEVFSQIRYAKKDSEFFTKEFLKVLKSQGFLK